MKLKVSEHLLSTCFCGIVGDVLPPVAPFELLNEYSKMLHSEKNSELTDKSVIRSKFQFIFKLKINFCKLTRGQNGSPALIL